MVTDHLCMRRYNPLIKRLVCRYIDFVSWKLFSERMIHMLLKLLPMLVVIYTKSNYRVVTIYDNGSFAYSAYLSMLFAI